MDDAFALLVEFAALELDTLVASFSEEIKAAFELDIAAVWFELDATVCELAAWLDVLWFAFEVEVATWLLVD